MKTVRKTTIIAKLIILAVIIIFFVILLLLKMNSGIAEEWTKGFARWYESTIGVIFKWVPFSLTEVVFLILIITGITLIVKIIISFATARPLRALSKFLSIETSYFIRSIYIRDLRRGWQSARPCPSVLRLFLSPHNHQDSA